MSFLLSLNLQVYLNSPGPNFASALLSFASAIRIHSSEGQHLLLLGMHVNNSYCLNSILCKTTLSYDYLFFSRELYLAANPRQNL